MYRSIEAPRVAVGRLPSGDRGTRRTLDIMRRLAAEGATHPVVRFTALNALRDGGAASHDPLSQLAALFRYVRDRILFVGDVLGVETLQAPWITIQAGAGDCDDRAVLLVSMARAVGIKAELRFRVIAANARRPAAFSHVYVVARAAGREIPLDPTYSTSGPGDEYPRAFRTAEVPA